MQRQPKTSVKSTGKDGPFSVAGLAKAIPTKQDTAMRSRRQQKRKPQNVKTTNNTIINILPMNVVQENKANVKPTGAKQQSPNFIVSVGQQSGKAGPIQVATNNQQQAPNIIVNVGQQSSNVAPIKVAGNNGEVPITFIPIHAALPSNLLVQNSMPYIPTLQFINSSLASTSATHSRYAPNKSTISSTAAFKHKPECALSRALMLPLQMEFPKLNMNERELYQQLVRYVIQPSSLKIFGFPVESVRHKGCVEIYKCLPKHLAEEAVSRDNQRHHRHYYGRQKFDIIKVGKDLYPPVWTHNAGGSYIGGHSSGSSSPSYTDSDSSEVAEELLISPIAAFFTPDGVYQIFGDYCNSIDKQCVRCSKMFQVNDNGDYLTYDSCSYHTGKLNYAANGSCYMHTYSCCQGVKSSKGCCKHPQHVWNGVVMGLNGPYTGFLHTQQKQLYTCPKIYAIDCEMSYTGLGLELTKVTVVGYDGALVYEHFVRPRAKIVDYNTLYSGVSEKDFMPSKQKYIKTFAEVQRDLLNLFDANTILIGHALDNDLKALGLVHKTIVDTSLIFAHSTGYPYRRSLKNLAKSYLKRDIQRENSGHNSLEDARACLDLVVYKIHADLFPHLSFE